MFEKVRDQDIIDRCNDLLESEDHELNLVTLYLIGAIIDLGEYFTDGVMSDGVNVFSYKIEETGLKMKLEKKSFSNNKEISKMSLDISNKLESDEM